jgi:hypothetical protein
MKIDVPLRTSYNYRYSEFQIKALNSYKKLAGKYKSLRTQLDPPDYLLAHDHVANDDTDYLKGSSPAEYMLKELTGTTEGQPPQIPKPITETKEFEVLEPLLLKAYK